MMTTTEPARVTLSPTTSSELERLAADVSLTAAPWQIAAQLAPALPAAAHDALLAFRHAQDDGALVVHGLGPGEVPDQASTYLDLPAAGQLLLGIVALVAIPAYAPEEWDGAPVTDVRVTAGLEQTASSKGQRELPLHQETQPLERPPDGLALLMVRGGNPTRIAAMADVVSLVASRDGTAMLDVMRQPLFAHQTSHSRGTPTLSEPVPILSGPDEAPELKVDLTCTQSTDAASEAALAALAAAGSEVAVEVDQVPGTLLLVDNRRWLHGRGPLPPTGTGRWLLRSYFVCDSWRTQQAPDHALMISA